MRNHFHDASSNDTVQVGVTVHKAVYLETGHGQSFSHRLGIHVNGHIVF
jgi:hypothetical protein